MKYLLFVLSVLGFAGFAKAAELDTNTAQLQAMDKITGKVSLLDAPVNAEVKFGTFSIVVRDCKTRAPGEVPENFAFLDVADTSLDGVQKNIFKGWVISSSPALNAVEHPIYDVWLIKCVDTKINPKNILGEAELRARDNMDKAELPEPKFSLIEKNDVKMEEVTTEEIGKNPEEEVILDEEIVVTTNPVSAPARVEGEPDIEGDPQSLLNFGEEDFSEEIIEYKD